MERPSVVGNKLPIRKITVAQLASEAVGVPRLVECGNHRPIERLVAPSAVSHVGATPKTVHECDILHPEVQIKLGCRIKIP